MLVRAFEFLVLLPLAVVAVLYVLYRMGVLRPRPQKSKRVLELEDQLEENRLLDQLMDPPTRSSERARRPDQRQ